MKKKHSLGQPPPAGLASAEPADDPTPAVPLPCHVVQTSRYLNSFLYGFWIAFHKSDHRLW